MTTIFDSDAVRDENRVFAQHQAVITLLQQRLANPTLPRLAWLDLACGRGQVVLSIKEGLSPQARSKIDFCGYDLDQRFVRETEQAASDAGLNSFKLQVGDLADFNHLLPQSQRFEFLTLTNAVHEIGPRQLAAVLVNCVARLADEGCLFVYDMEKIIPPELGALAWTGEEIRKISKCLVGSLGVETYLPEVGRWAHKTCFGWNLQLQRNLLGISRGTLERRRDFAIDATHKEIGNLLKEKLLDCQTALDALTRRGAETAREAKDKGPLLHDYWALSRAVEAGQ